MLFNYLKLMRFHKPIGIFLLLWPTLWALWIAGNGHPDFFIVGIFVAGTIVMRAAGCVVNDIADRNLDRHVARTAERPLTAEKITLRGALSTFGFLCVLALLLARQLNTFALTLALPALGLAILYPFMKRFTHWPQCVLGCAFSFAILMAFAALTHTLPPVAWLLFAANTLWVIAYDTQYALVDKADDIKIGIKSTAVLFGVHAFSIIITLQAAFLALLIGVGVLEHLNLIFYTGILIAGSLFGYQGWLMKKTGRQDPFRAFINNHWVGTVVFIGLFLGR